jgi:hypothetical protein
MTSSRRLICVSRAQMRSLAAMSRPRAASWSVLVVVFMVVRVVPYRMDTYKQMAGRQYVYLLCAEIFVATVPDVPEDISVTFKAPPALKDEFERHLRLANQFKTATAFFLAAMTALVVQVRRGDKLRVPLELVAEVAEDRKKV